MSVLLVIAWRTTFREAGGVDVDVDVDIDDGDVEVMGVVDKELVEDGGKVLEGVEIVVLLLCRDVLVDINAELLL